MRPQPQQCCAPRWRACAALAPRSPRAALRFVPDARPQLGRMRDEFEKYRGVVRRPSFTRTPRRAPQCFRSVARLTHALCVSDRRCDG